MSRISACKDPSRWHGVVIRWLDRRAKDLAEKLRRSREKVAKERADRGEPPAPPDPPLGLPRELNPRLKLPIYLELAEHSPQYAGVIVAHYYVATKAHARVDPRVVAYIDKAGERYYRDPKQNIRKALGLLKSRRGNPGRVFSKKEQRRLTPEGYIQAADMALGLMASGRSEKYAVLTVKDVFDVSSRTVRKGIADEQAKRKEREHVNPGYRRASRER